MHVCMCVCSNKCEGTHAHTHTHANMYTHIDKTNIIQKPRFKSKAHRHQATHAYPHTSTHTHTRKQMGMAAAQTAVLPQRPGEPDCAFFMKTGKCKYGDTCKFHHPIGGISSHYPVRPGEPECTFYMKTGAENMILSLKLCRATIQNESTLCVRVCVFRVCGIYVYVCGPGGSCFFCIDDILFVSLST
jgi:hypothetical protein